MIQDNLADVVRNLPSTSDSQYQTNTAASRHWDLLKRGIQQCYEYEISSSSYLSLLFHLAKIKCCDIMQTSSFSEADLLAFDKLLLQLENILFPDIFLLLERLKFSQRERNVMETAEYYLHVLQTLSETCEFGKEKCHRIKKQFITGGHLHPTLLQLCENTLETDLMLVLKTYAKGDVHNKTNLTDDKNVHPMKYQKCGQYQRNVSKKKDKSKNALQNRLMISYHSKGEKTLQRNSETICFPTKHQNFKPSPFQEKDGNSGLKLSYSKLNQSARKRDIISRGNSATETSYTHLELLPETQESPKFPSTAFVKDACTTLLTTSETVNNSSCNEADNCSNDDSEKLLSSEVLEKSSSLTECVAEQDVVKSDSFKEFKNCVNNDENIVDESNRIMALENSHVQEEFMKCYKQEKGQDSPGEVGDSDLTAPKTEKCSKLEWTCEICHEEFSKKAAFQKHVKTHKCECSVCGRKFNWQSRLSKHMACHTGVKYVPKKRLIGPKPKKGRQHEEYTCTQCQARLRGKREYKKHMRIHECQCDICGKVLDCKYSFKLHKDGHIGNKPFKCSQCSRAFTRKSDLTAHLHIHDPGRRKCHVCDYCGKDFFRIHELNRHRRLHTGDKPFECDVCGKAFPTSYGLKCHRFLHTGIKSYTCDKCGKSFAQKSNLDMHLFRHTGVKEHECSVCQVKFSKKCYLESHIRSHTKERPHTCEICGACVSSKYSLTRHRLIHTGEKPHVCLICNKSFTWHSTYKKHIENHADVDHSQKSTSLDLKFSAKQKQLTNYNDAQPGVDTDISVKNSSSGDGEFHQPSHSGTSAEHFYQKCSRKDLEATSSVGDKTLVSSSYTQSEQLKHLHYHPQGGFLPQHSHHQECSVQQHPEDCSLKEKTVHPHHKQYFHPQQSLPLQRTSDESRTYSYTDPPTIMAYDTIVLEQVTQQEN